MKKQIEILCVGHSVIDVAVQYGTITPELMSDRNVAKNIDIHPGGDAMNQAVFLGAAGKSVGLYTIAGAEPYAKIINDCLHANNVERIDDTSGQGALTMVSVVMVDEKGDRKFITNKPNFDGHLEIPRELLGNTRFLSYASFFGSDDLDRFAPILFSWARKQGIVIIADITGGGLYKEGPVNDCLHQIDYFIPSIKEAIALTGLSLDSHPEEIAFNLLSRGCRNVILKLGEQGCYFSNGQESFYCEPFAVEKIVDTTGAGDTFVAGFVFGLASGWDVSSSIQFAQAGAAICIGRQGACAVVKGSDEIFDFLEKHDCLKSIL
jgi:sugar/nucleoside kinase (ribokinase family)